jgi:acyl-CoA reductase-like NAD-dependent aldehyde dehydrogenase
MASCTSGGQWVAPAVGGVLEVRSPPDRSLTGIAPHAAPADVDGAVAAARRAFDEGPWPRMSPQERRAASTEVARRIRAGWMSVNGVPAALDGAFGGYKSSGIGREIGATGLAQYIDYKTIAA